MSDVEGALAKWRSTVAANPCLAFKDDGRTLRCLRCGWHDSAHGVYWVTCQRCLAGLGCDCHLHKPREAKP